MPLLAALVVFGAIASLVLALTWKQEGALSARIAGLRGEGASLEANLRSDKAAPITARVFGPLAGSLGTKLSAILPARWLEGIDHKLVQAGQPTSRNGFLMAIALVEATFLGFAATMMVSSSLSGPLALLVLGGFAVFGVVMPKVWLDNRVRFRQKEILKSLPDAFDLITTCVEAGLGLEAALARVAEKTAGPFGEELALSLREVSMGKLRRDSLKEMSERIGVADLSSFINAVIQAESMGTSIAAVLRVQAEQMRTKRRQRAEQQAHQAPIKMMFPLVLCIFPTLFIVILGPAGIQIYQQLVSKH